MNCHAYKIMKIYITWIVYIYLQAQMIRPLGAWADIVNFWLLCVIPISMLLCNWEPLEKANLGKLYSCLAFSLSEFLRVIWSTKCLYVDITFTYILKYKAKLVGQRKPSFKEPLHGLRNVMRLYTQKWSLFTFISFWKHV